MKNSIFAFKSFFQYIRMMPLFKRILFIAICSLIIAYCVVMWTLSAFAPWNYVEIAIAALVCMLVIIYVAFYSEFKINVFVLLAIAFILISVVSFLMNIKYSTFPKTIIMLFTLAIIIYQFVSIDKKHLNIVIFAILIGTFIFSMVYTITYNKALFDFSDFTRLGSDFDNQNAVGRAFAILEISIVYLALKKRIYFLFPFALFPLFLCLTTGSISNLLCIFIINVLIFFFHFKIKGKITVAVVSAILIAIICILLQQSFAGYFNKRIQNIIYTFFGIGSGRVDNSTLDRFILAVDAFRFFLEKPLFGNGYSSVYLYTSGYGLFSHNNIVELLANFGLFGFICYECILLLPLVIYRFKYKKTSNVLVPIISFVLVFQLFLVTFYLKIDCLLMPLMFCFIDEDLFIFKIKFSINNRKLSTNINIVDNIRIQTSKDNEYKVISI